MNKEQGLNLPFRKLYFPFSYVYKDGLNKYHKNTISNKHINRLL